MYFIRYTISLMMAKTIYYFGTHTLLFSWIFSTNIQRQERVYFDALGVFVIFYKIYTIVGSGDGKEGERFNNVCSWYYMENGNGTPNIFLEISLILIWCEI